MRAAARRIAVLRALVPRPCAYSSRVQALRSLSTAPEAHSSSKPEQSGGPLARLLRDSIKITGALPIARYMQFCLSHPVHGYYARGDVFGRKGDFITSPEISQIFGELVAIWLLTRYMSAGSPEKVRIVELGPGRGTLMDDVLRTLGTFPGIKDAIRSILLIDNSEKMQALQKEKLGKQCADMGVELTWNDRFELVEPSDEFTLFIAHEFFDAMPINVFEQTEEGYREVVIDLDRAEDNTPITDKPGSGLRFVLNREENTLSQLLPATSPRFPNLPVGTRIEVAQDSWKTLRKVGQVLGASVPLGGGGAGLIIDYGGDRVYSDSFRAFRTHQIVDVFEDPGSADLTANVDFAYLRESLEKTGTHALGPIPQAEFLLRLGLAPRLQKLIDSAPTPERKDDIIKGAQRLVDPQGMGAQYQVMGITTTPEGTEVYPFPVGTAESKDAPLSQETPKD